MKAALDRGVRLRLIVDAKPNDIQHNKFMVLPKGAADASAAVWTGSTNLSMGSIHEQINVRHWVRDAEGRTICRESVAVPASGRSHVTEDSPGGLARSGPKVDFQQLT